MKYILSLDLTEPLVFLSLSIAMFVIVVSRYFILSGIFHLYFYVWKREIWENRKLNKKAYPPQQFRKEIYWSMLTALIFSVVGALVGILWQKDYTAIYLKINDFPLWWFPVSIMIDRKSTRLNSSHRNTSRMPSSA